MWLGPGTRASEDELRARLGSREAEDSAAQGTLYGSCPIARANPS